MVLAMSDSQIYVNTMPTFGKASSSKIVARRFSNASQITRWTRGHWMVSISVLEPSAKISSVSTGQGSRAMPTFVGGSMVDVGLVTGGGGMDRFRTS